jgi:hypothetical protein
MQDNNTRIEEVKGLELNANDSPLNKTEDYPHWTTEEAKPINISKSQQVHRIPGISNYKDLLE